ncbi:hypothetical protein [Halomicrococcus sp. NG-SE-24]|uniref:hypothetical protein n=1 Tax=Halomicrococcus sp. NG-SE-24 TaxID=3436928 RepID=UPI003D964AD2
MTAGHTPNPLNPRQPAALTRQLSPRDRIRLTTTRLPRTILTVTHVQPPTDAQPARLVLTAPPVTTTAQQSGPQRTYYDCIAAAASSTMTVIESTYTPASTTTRPVGSLTTIVRLPDCSTTPASDDRPAMEAAGNE